MVAEFNRIRCKLEYVIDKVKAFSTINKYERRFDNYRYRTAFLEKKIVETKEFLDGKEKNYGLRARKV